MPTSSIPVVKKAHLLSEIQRMEEDLERLRRRLHSLPTKETRSSLEGDGDRLAATQGSLWSWLRWFRSAQAWCLLHELDCADAFPRWDRYRTAASNVWREYWEQWCRDFGMRLERVRNETDRRILDSIWRDWRTLSAEAVRLGWSGAPPAGWERIEAHMTSMWTAPPSPQRLVDLFDVE